MKQITFAYYMQLQTRFIIFKASQLKISELEVATRYAFLMRKKLEQKYTLIFWNHYIRL